MWGRWPIWQHAAGGCFSAGVGLSLMGRYEGGGEEGGWNCVDGERAGGGGEERKRPCSRTVRLAFAQAGPPSFFLSFFLSFTCEDGPCNGWSNQLFVRLLVVLPRQA
jgi:hypothetical protein